SRLLAFSVVCAMLWAGCASPTPTPAPAPTASPATQPPAGTAARGLALVTRIDVLPPGGPAGPAHVVAHGQLPDGCTALAGQTVDRQAQTFIVTIATLRQESAACAAAGQTFEQSIDLDTASAPAGDYVVVVNGVSGSLKLTV